MSKTLNKHQLVAYLERGVTLIELMVTILVMAILLAIAVPSFQEAILLSRIRSYANEIAASAMLARSEALKRNRTVNLCISTNGTSCTTGEWGSGWIVIDQSVPTVLQAHSAVDANFRVKEAADLTSLDFPPSGVGVTSASFTVCRASPVGNQERVVNISVSGRPVITKTTTGSCS